MAPVTRQRPGATLREQLLTWTNAAAESGEPQRVVVMGRHYLLTPVATVGCGRLQLCEWPRSPRLPEYRSRQLLHALAGERAITVFTDAAGTKQVWGWTRQMPFAAPAYTEVYGAWDRPESIPSDLVAAEDAGWSVRDVAAAAAGAEAVRLALIARLIRDPRFARLLRAERGLESATRLQRVVERARTPGVPRRVWRELTGLRVLDPACGSGSWLAGCLSALTAVGAACIQWMQYWVEDCSGGRADRDADFRRLLACARDLGASGRRDRFVLETVLLRCLYGAEPDVEAAARAQAQLAGRLAPAGEADISSDEEAFADVRSGRLAGGEAPLRTRVERLADATAFSAAAMAVSADAEALGRAWEQITRARLQTRAPTAEVREGREEIRRWRQALSARLRHAGGGQEEAAVLYPFIEFHDVLRAGGFHLVRACTGSPEEGGGPGPA